MSEANFNDTTRKVIPSSAWGTFAPTVTLVGGVSNTVPVYSTNTGRYIQYANIVFVEVLLTGDGGDEGGGSGILNIALPVTAGASHPGERFHAGYFENSTSLRPLFGTIAGGGTTVSLDICTSVLIITGAAGSDQNSTTRSIRLKFFYEI
mgnify:CR=1 FL=1